MSKLKLVAPIVALALVALVAILTLSGDGDPETSPRRPDAPFRDAEGETPPDTGIEPPGAPGGVTAEGDATDAPGPEAEGPCLTVTVKDAAGNPVPGATLRLLERDRYEIGGWASGPRRDQFLMGIEVLDRGEAPPGAAGTTDATGEFRFEGLEPGKHYLSAKSSGMATGEITEIEVPEKGEKSVSIVLAPGAAITGKVLDTRRRPIARARVLGAQWNKAVRLPYGPMETAQSGPDGSFRLEGFPPGQRTMLFARAPDGRIGVGIRIDAPSEDVELMVGPRFKLVGSVVDDETGDPIEGAQLYALLGYAQSDESGRYEIEGVAKSAFFRYVWVEKDGYEADPHEIDLGSALFGGKTIEQTFRLTRIRPAKLTVRVLDGEGNLLPGVALVVTTWRDEKVRARGVTGATGEAVIEEFPPKGARIKAMKPGFVQASVRDRNGVSHLGSLGEQRVSVEPGSESSLEIRMVQAAIVRGRVKDAEGNALEGVRVGLWNRDPVTTKADGTFEAGNLPKGLTIPLGFAKDGYVRVTRLTVPGSGDEIEAVLHRGGVLAGRVVDEAGRPVSGADMSVEGERMHRSFESEPDGTFKVMNLEPGTYTVSAYRKGFVTGQANGIVLAPGKSREDVVVELRKGITVDLAAIGPDGEIAAAVWVLYGPVEKPEEERIHQTRHASTGEAERCELIPGRYQVLIAPSLEVGAGAVDTTVDLTSAGDVRIPLPGDAKRVTVRLPGGGGVRGGIQVQRTEPEKPRLTVWSMLGKPSEDGLIRTHALPPGKYRVLVYWEVKEANSWENKVFEDIEPGGPPIEVE